MKRSPGVTLGAILSMVGSAVTLLFGILILLIAFVFATGKSQFPGSPSFYKAILGLSAFIYIVPAIWGIFTSVGLFRLKNWARISIIVFSVLLVLMATFAGLIALLVPLPPSPNKTVDQSVMTTVRLFMGAFWLALDGIGVWWLVLFNCKRVKEQFVGAMPPPSAGSSPQTAYLEAPVSARPALGGRPLSITIIAALLLVGCAFVPLNWLLHTPAIFFTKILVGSAAAAFYAAFLALSLLLGIGLLRLREMARLGAITYYVVLFINSAVFYLAPGGRERLLTFIGKQQAMWPWMRQFRQQSLQVDLWPFLLIGGIVGLLGLAVPIYFLITRRQAFVGQATAPAT